MTALRRSEVPYGESGNCWKLMQSITGIGWSLMRSNRKASLLSPLFAMVPVFSVVNYFREHAFAWYWGRKNRTMEPEGNALSLAVEL